MAAHTRPTGVTAVAWIIIVLGALTELIMQAAARIPEARNLLSSQGLPAHIIVPEGVVYGMIILISGIAMLNGLNWGRIIYLCIEPIAIALAFAYGFDVLLAPVIYLIFLLVLTRPSASAFFRGEAPRA